MSERLYDFELKGVSPLLMHWDNLEAEAKFELWKGRPENAKLSKAGDDRTPPWRWKDGVYNDGRQVVVPSDNLRSCLCMAAAQVPRPKGRGGCKAIIAAETMFLAPFLGFTNRGTVVMWDSIRAIDGTFPEQLTAVEKLGFRLFVKRAAVQSSKHVRVRACFDEWSVFGQIVILGDIVTDAILENCFRLGGFYQGLCDGRPGSKKSPWPYGKFEAFVKRAP